MIGRLARLRNRGVGELAERGRQAARAWAEAAGLSGSGRLASDKTVLGEFQVGSAEELLEHFRSRKRVFYPAFQDRGAVVRVFEERFGGDRAALIERADGICDGRFSLLGYRDLVFGSQMPDWHLEPIADKRAPRVHWSKIEADISADFGDNKIIWELNRHQYFAVLGRAYWLTGDEKYAKVFAAHVDDWCENNPPKLGINWVSSLEIAFRSMSWIWAFNFFRDSPALSGSLLLRMVKFLKLNGRHIENYLSTYSSPNTHLTGEALGLYFIGSFLHELEEGRRWKALGSRILADALEFQIADDGVYCEQSSHYQRYTVDFYSNWVLLMRAAGEAVDSGVLAKLHSMYDFLLHLTQPNGEIPLIGDDDGGRLHSLDETPVPDVRSTLALGAVLLERGDLKFAAGEAGQELLWLTGAEGISEYDQLEATEPEERAKAFNSGGYYAARTSWQRDASSVLINCGPHGFMNGGHAHADALGFVLSINGEPVFIDAGTYKYAADPEQRDLFRSTQMHNCMTVDGRSSSTLGGPWSWRSMADAELKDWQTDGEQVSFRGTHNGFEHIGVSYERSVLFEEGGMNLRDKIKTAVERLIEVHLILAPGLEVRTEDDVAEVFSLTEGSRKIAKISTEVIYGSGDDGGHWRVEPCFVSPVYGAKVRSQKLIYAVTAKGELEIRSDIRW